MASYVELAELQFNGRLKQQARVAVMVSASSIQSEPPQTTNHQERLKWAAWTLRNTEISAAQMVPAVLATNRDSTVAQITSASDAAIQLDVDANVDLFALTLT